MKRRDFMTGCGLFLGALLTGCGLKKDPDEFVVDGEYEARFDNTRQIHRQYLVFENLPLSRFGNRIPSITSVHLSDPSMEYVFSGTGLFPLVFAREIEERVHHAKACNWYSYHATFAYDVDPDITVERIWMDGTEIVKGGDDTYRFRFQMYHVSDQLMHDVPMAAGDDFIDHIKKIGRPV